jgi:SAM-dependent methyltransferase
MKTSWTDAEVSHLFDAYDDHVEAALGYRPLIADLKASHGTQIHVLDYGCGGGKVSRRLAQAGIEAVTGVDISATMVGKAFAHPVREGIRYLQVASGVLPFPDASFDAAVCCFVFINVHERAELGRIAAGIHRTLRPGGTLYLLDTNPSSTGVRFTTFRNGDAGAAYADGEARPVYLDVPEHGVFKIIDTHWEKATYLDVLRAAGFGTVRMLEPTAGDLPARDRARLSGAEGDRPPFVMFKAGKPDVR